MQAEAERKRRDPMKRRTLEELTAEANAKAEALNAKLAMKKLLERDGNVRRATRIVDEILKFLAASSPADVETLGHDAMVLVRGLRDWINGKAKP